MCVCVLVVALIFNLIALAFLMRLRWESLSPSPSLAGGVSRAEGGNLGYNCKSFECVKKSANYIDKLPDNLPDNLPANLPAACHKIVSIKIPQLGGSNDAGQHRQAYPFWQLVQLWAYLTHAQLFETTFFQLAGRHSVLPANSIWGNQWRYAYAA